MRLQVGVLARRVEVRLQRAQAAGALALADRASVWALRSRYATLRPAGWRSDPAARVPWRCVSMLLVHIASLPCGILSSS